MQHPPVRAGLFFCSAADAILCIRTLPKLSPPCARVSLQAMGRGMGMGRIFSPYHESWRKHPMLQPKFRDCFPGFGYAVVIFSTYCTAELIYTKLSGKKGGH